MSKKTSKNRKQILFLCQFSLLLAIEIIVCFTPLGTLPSLGMLSATLSHVPVIITAIVLGMKAGTLMGLAFGACSFIYWTFVAPGAFSFLYTPFYTMGEYSGNFGSLLICFLPRILIGVVTALAMKGFTKVLKNEFAAAAVAGILGTLTNTLLVLGGIYIFFGNEYYAMAVTDSSQTLLAFLGTVILTNGLPEAVIGGIAGSAIAVPVKKAVKKYM